MSESRHGPHQHQPAPGAATHGMLVFGDNRIYVSHLPMFHPPHNVQAVAEVSFASGDTQLYRQDRAETGEKVYTLEPEQFVLQDLVSHSGEPAPRSSFQAVLYRGHFERGGQPIVHDVTVTVERIAYVRELPVERSGDRELMYRCLGGPGELFFVHEIQAPPDFDQVLRFRFTEPEFEKLEFSGEPVRILDRADDLERRLNPGDKADAFFFQSIGPRGQHGFSTTVVVEDEIYLESGELAR